MPVQIGELLLKENMISSQQLQDALNHRKLTGGKLATALVSLGFVKEEEIASLISRKYGVPWIDLHTSKVDPVIIKMLPADLAWKYQVLPLSRSGTTLSIAVADPTDAFAMDAMRFLTRCDVTPVVAAESALRDAIHRYGPPPHPGQTARPHPNTVTCREGSACPLSNTPRRGGPGAPLAGVRGPLHQPLLLGGRPRDHQDHPCGNGAEIQGTAPLSLRCHAVRRHD